ncbi:MAG: hypothetical protein GX131_07360 [candidate division WS1 bacterium]|nr:hypothetical protein [candidate division WS1 bacterium]
MADTKLNLEFLSPEKREFLRRRLEQRDSLLRRRLERIVDEAMEDTEEEATAATEEDSTARPHRPIDDFVSCHTPETLAQAREADRRLNALLKQRAAEGDRSSGLSEIIGIVRGDGTVSGRNFHDYLYGWGDDNG